MEEFRKKFLSPYPASHVNGGKGPLSSPVDGDRSSFFSGMDPQFFTKRTPMRTYSVGQLSDGSIDSKFTTRKVEEFAKAGLLRRPPAAESPVAQDTATSRKAGGGDEDTSPQSKGPKETEDGFENSMETGLEPDSFTQISAEKNVVTDAQTEVSIRRGRRKKK
ncbi:MAG: hypothetical protein GY795_08950, partial [Desulfobacterales bacterium]|nr:hypothetical protein [Desulfobacterales bacterium]